VPGVQTCALPISRRPGRSRRGYRGPGRRRTVRRLARLCAGAGREEGEPGLLADGQARSGPARTGLVRALTRRPALLAEAGRRLRQCVAPQRHDLAVSLGTSRIEALPRLNRTPPIACRLRAAALMLVRWTPSMAASRA